VSGSGLAFVDGMRPPFPPDALENKPATNSSVSRDPSYPDRARIDSDVRAFLRPVSTPWIVFDRDSRVDDFAKSALRVGAVFASSPSFRPEVIQAAAESGSSVEEIAAQPMPELAAPESVIVREPFQPGAVLAPAMSSVLPDTGTFPSSTSACQSAGEPSNVVVAADVFPDSASAIALECARPSLVSDPFASPPAVVARRGRIAAIAGACAGVLALVGVSAIVLAGGARAEAKAASAAQAVQVSVAAAAIATPVSAEARDEVPAPPSVTVDAPTREPAAAKAPTDPKKRFGKLTIKGEARRKNVWFDGKRMLGSGRRSFTVFCGMHTIAVSDKSDAKDVEVPCNGEYVVSK